MNYDELKAYDDLLKASIEKASYCAGPIPIGEFGASTWLLGEIATAIQTRIQLNDRMRLMDIAKASEDKQVVRSSCENKKNDVGVYYT